MSEAGGSAVELLREQSRKGLRHLMNRMLASSEQALLSMAGKARSNAEQNLYFEAMREFRLRRRPIEERFLPRVMAAFEGLGKPKPVAAPIQPKGPKPLTLDIDSISLVQDSMLEESLAVDNIASRARQTHRDALMRLAQYVATESGNRKFSMEDLPVDPEALAQSFMDVCNEIEINAQSKMVFSKLFTRFVIDELAPFYEQCLEVMPQAAQPEAPKTVTATPDALKAQDLPTAVRTEQEKAEEEAGKAEKHRVEEIWDTARTPLLAPPGKAPAMPKNQLDELLRTVQQALLDRKSSLSILNPKLAPRPLEILELLNAEMQSQGYSRPSALPFDVVESVNLVKLLFEHALRDQQVPGPIRRLLVFLQLPLLRAAMRDGDALSGNTHPLRQLMKAITGAAVGWAPSGEVGKDELYRRIHGIVTRIARDYDKDTAIFDESLETLNDFLKSERSRARLLESRTLNAEMGKAEAEAARKAVAELIDEGVSGTALQPAVLEFLRGAWSDALFVVRLQDGAESGAWQLAVETTARLLTSARAADRQGGGFAVLAQGLKLGLKRLGQGDDVVANALANVEKALREAAPADSSVTPSPTAARSRQRVETAGEKTLELVDKLSPDTWVEFQDAGGGEARRARLLTRIPASGQLLFVNRSGAKAGEWSRNDFALAVERGTAVIVSEPGKESSSGGGILKRLFRR